MLFVVLGMGGNLRATSS